MPSLSLHDLRRFVARCDPARPLKDLQEQEELYVQFDQEVALRGDGLSCMEQLWRNIALASPGQPTCQLFTGFPGSGKTTELYRLAHVLEDPKSEAPVKVIIVDALSYLDQYTPLTITDILRILAYHLDREATRATGGDPDATPGWGKRLWRWLQSDVQLKEIGFEAYGASLMAEIKDNKTFYQKVQSILELRFQEFAREAHESIQESLNTLRRANGGRDVVLIVDSLEKLSALRPEDRSHQEASVEAVFRSHARWLRLPCHTIYTFPVWLRHRAGNLGAIYDSPPLTLPMVKVRERSGEPCLTGVAQMKKLIGKRIDRLEDFFGSPSEVDRSLERLILASGGYPRDLLRLVRDCIRLSKSFPVTREVIESSIDRLREEYRNVLLRANLDVLRYVHRHQALPPGEAALFAASWSLDQWQILTYRNGEEWFDLHPLLLDAPPLRDATIPLPAPGALETTSDAQTQMNPQASAAAPSTSADAEGAS